MSCSVELRVITVWLAYLYVLDFTTNMVAYTIFTQLANVSTEYAFVIEMTVCDNCKFRRKN